MTYELLSNKVYSGIKCEHDTNNQMSRKSIKRVLNINQCWKSTHPPQIPDVLRIQKS